MSQSEQNPKRQTVKNFWLLISSGQFVEIFKVLRRRLINGLKFFRRVFLYFWLKVYDYAPLLKKRQLIQMQKIMSVFYGSSSNSAQAKLTVGLVLREGLTHPKSSAFIRLIGPLTDPQIKDQIKIKLLPDNTTSIDDDIDIYIIQRTAYDNLSTAKQFTDNLRQAGKLLVIDTDDAFSLIDPTHPEHSEHKDKVYALNYLLGEADQVWLSTDRLQPFLPALKHKPKIVKNSLDPRVWQLSNLTIKSLNGPLNMVYMGTGTHSADLDMILPALDKVALEHPKSFNLTIIGVASEIPERDWLKRRHVRRSLTVYPKFVKWFLKQGPYDIGLCPLVNSSFNNSKTDIKCLDYLGANTVPVVSNVAPYQSAELNDLIIRVKDVDWTSILSNLVSNTIRVRQNNSVRLEKAKTYLKTQRSSTKVARQLLEFLQELKQVKPV